MAKGKKNITVTEIPNRYPSRYKSQWAVSGSAAEPYTVSEGRTGDWECSCMAWTRTTPREDCKHILRVRLANNVGSGTVPVHAQNASVVIHAGRKFRDN